MDCRNQWIHLGSCRILQCHHRYFRIYFCCCRTNRLSEKHFPNLRKVYAEHRYYGKSLPFGDRSLESVEFSGYLTPEQALADYALLLTKVNRELRPVITWGGSYGGLLSSEYRIFYTKIAADQFHNPFSTAWFRMKYPHLSTGAIASSAPLVQFTTDCQTFRQLTTAVYSAAHVNCSQNIKKSWPIIKWVTLIQ